MANAVTKVNGIAIADIAKINSQDDDDLAKLNTLEFTGGYTFSSLTWTTATVAPFTRSSANKIGTAALGGCTEGADTNFHEWNGTWSVGGSTAIRHGSGMSGGSLAAGVIYAGYDNVAGDETSSCEFYSSGTWSSDAATNLTTGHAYPSGGGYLQTAQLCTGGSSYGPTVRDLKTTQTYNGSTWTDESQDSNGRSLGVVVGIADNFVKINGTLDASGMSDAVEHWNGSAWSGMSSSPTEGGGGQMGFGVETRAFKAGGYGRDDYGAPYYYDTTDAVEMWVGTLGVGSWSTESSLPASQAACGYGGGEGGGGSDGIAGWTAGGYTRVYPIGSNTLLNTHYIAEEGG